MVSLINSEPNSNTANLSSSNKRRHVYSVARSNALPPFIINGKGGGILDPGGQATRAETAQMLKNFMEND